MGEGRPSMQKGPPLPQEWPKRCEVGRTIYDQGRAGRRISWGVWCHHLLDKRMSVKRGGSVKPKIISHILSAWFRMSRRFGYPDVANPVGNASAPIALTGEVDPIGV